MKQLAIIYIFFLTVPSTYAGSFQSGYYYDLQGRKLDGLLQYVQGSFGLLWTSSGYLKFKNNPDSKTISLSPNEIQSFVIGTDSFVVLKNIKVNSTSGNFKKDFAVVNRIGAVNLYVHQCRLYNGRFYFEHPSYILSKGDSSTIIIWKPNKQKEQIARFFQDRNDLEKLVISDKYYLKIPELVDLYNSSNIERSPKKLD